MKECVTCKASFGVDQKDVAFYQKLDLPEPERCPPCRMQQRILFRNFFKLYHRKCDLTGKQIISMYHQDLDGPVYEMKEWWSDKWNALEYGFEPDLSKPLFPQLQKLHRTVPRMSIVNTQCENTDYCNLSFQSKNCYLVFGNVRNEDCSYGHIVWQSKNCFDCLYTYRSEYCYECIDCVDCYNLSWSRSSENCSDSRFLVHCTDVRNSFGCVGLKNKEYHIFNEPHTKEAYEQKIKQFNSGNRAVVAFALQKVQELIGDEIVKSYHGHGCEDVSGDYLYNCKNTFDSFDAKNCEDSRYLATAESFTNSYDCNYCPNQSEWCYNSTAIDGYNLIGCHNVLNQSSQVYYSDNCYSCKDCFGCVGLKNKQYCLFNVQYSKEEYEALLPQVISHMKSTGEWGEFFPAEMSPFAYNETMAQEYFPLSKDQAIAQGYRWREEEQKAHYQGPVYEVPDDIADVGADIVEKVLHCQESGKPFKLTNQEMAFYRHMNLPVPQLCPDVRHAKRMDLRNPRKLWSRSCQNCKEDIQTTYAPDRPEKVYCESCYLAAVY